MSKELDLDPPFGFLASGKPNAKLEQVGTAVQVNPACRLSRGSLVGGEGTGAGWLTWAVAQGMSKELDLDPPFGFLACILVSRVIETLLESHRSGLTSGQCNVH
ncbi:hypothetical protein Pelo_18934 [Pelomyxa schiedti]|nr:hypothetical protein Pelo_18934 [Pelomyxa schiedti]